MLCFSLLVERKNMNNISNRNIYLDYLRAISALLIALYHYTCRYEELFTHIEAYPIVISFGGKAVAIFFLLSGYFAVQHIDGRTFKQYILGRFLRLYPIYWISVTVTFVLCRFFLISRSVSLKDFLINLTMLPDLFGANYVDGAYWTLQYEIVFYLIIGLLCLLRLNKHAGKFFMSWTIAYGTYLALRHFGYLNSFSFINYSGIFLLFNCYGVSFIAGSLLACIEKEITKEKRNIMYISILVISLIINICFCFVQHDVTYFVFFLIGIVLIITSLILHKKGHSKSLVYKLFMPLSFVASISYPFYLLHQNIGYIIIITIEKMGFTNEVFVLLPLVLMLLVSWLINSFVGKLIVKRFNRKIAKIK